MKSKKGVTEPILIIGVLIIAATIFILGTTRVLVPLIKTQPEFLATDIGIAVNAVYAAPETLLVQYTIATPKDKAIGYEFYTRGDFRKISVKGEGIIEKSYTITKDTNIKPIFKGLDTGPSNPAIYYPDANKGQFTITMNKTWISSSRGNLMAFG